MPWIRHLALAVSSLDSPRLEALGVGAFSLRS